MYVCMYECTYVRMHVCMYVCVYGLMYACCDVCLYTCIVTEWPFGLTNKNVYV